MLLEKLKDDFSVCKVHDYTLVDLNLPYCFIGNTDKEKSLVCPTQQVPANVIAREDGWRAFRVQGVLDFSLVGILANISNLLANHEISIFVISTFDTDYLWVKKENVEKAESILVCAGYRIVE